MRREFYFFIGGFLSGVVFSFYLYRKRKKILDQINAIEKKVRNIVIKERIREMVIETIESLKKILLNTKEVPDEEKEYILKKVEEKIRKLEEIV